MRRSGGVVRRTTLAVLLAAAAGVSVGDDVGTAPDVRRGSRTIAVDLPEPLGATTLHVPRTEASGVAIVLHRGTLQALDPLLDALAASTLVVPVDTSAPAVRASSCDALVDALALTSRQAQREAGLTVYRAPVVVGLDGAAALARGVVLTSDADVFASGIGDAVERDDAARAAPCRPAASRAAATRWHDASPVSVAIETEAVLATPAARPTTGHAPLDRWLTHFALPMAADWAPRPRAVVVLMSDARALRHAHPRLAARLASADVSVLTIDALRYFWQRRSPRDVAFELRRLLGALASLDVPILVGGLGSGAETMAVAARYIDGDAPDGLVLIDPGPSAFFEVDPPLPALLPLIRADWSTADAVEALAMPTLCAAADETRAGRVCGRLAGLPHVRVVLDHPATVTARGDDRLAARIVDLATQARPSSRERTSRPAQPRKPST